MAILWFQHLWGLQSIQSPLAWIHKRLHYSKDRTMTPRCWNRLAFLFPQWPLRYGRISGLLGSWRWACDFLPVLTQALSSDARIISLHFFRDLELKWHTQDPHNTVWQTGVSVQGTWWQSQINQTPSIKTNRSSQSTFLSLNISNMLTVLSISAGTFRWQKNWNLIFYSY